MADADVHDQGTGKRATNVVSEDVTAATCRVLDVGRQCGRGSTAERKVGRGPPGQSAGPATLEWVMWSLRLFQRQPRSVDDYSSRRSGDLDDLPDSL